MCIYLVNVKNVCRDRHGHVCKSLVSMPNFLQATMKVPILRTKKACQVPIAVMKIMTQQPVVHLHLIKEKVQPQISNIIPLAHKDVSGMSERTST